MKVLWFSGDSEAQIKDMPTPKPASGQVLIRMKAAGLCGSDLHGIYERPRKEIEGRRQWIPGHEPAGVVEALGSSVGELEIGDPVLVDNTVGCGECKLCRMGWYNLCVGPREKRGFYGFGLDGCFADYMVAEDRNCIKKPDWLSFEVGAHLTCGGGTVYSALKRLNITTDDTALAIGLGPVGLGGVALMKAWKARVIAVDMTEERVKLAKTLGADETIDASKENVLDRVKELTGGNGVEVAVDFSGSPIGRNNCIDSAGLFGRVAFVGERNPTTIDPSRQLLGKRITIYSSRVYGYHELMELLEFMKRHELHLEKMITHRFPLEKGPDALKLFQTTQTGKIIFTWP